MTIYSSIKLSLFTGKITDGWPRSDLVAFRALIRDLAGPDGNGYVFVCCKNCKRFQIFSEDRINNEWRKESDYETAIENTKKSLRYENGSEWEPRTLEVTCPDCDGENLKGLKLRPEFRESNRPETIRKVVIVDDEEGICKAFERFKKSLGFNIKAINPQNPSRTKEQVLELIKVEMPDLVIMDGKLGGGMLGSEIIAELREAGFENYILANSSDSDMSKKMIDAGADFESEDKLTPFVFKEKFF